MKEDKDNIIRSKSFDFALLIIELYRQMLEEKEYVLSKQLLRSGTSIGANIEEASAAISRKDFIAKMSISAKEARETLYWLKLINKSKIVKTDVSELLEKSDELIRILTSIVKTSQSST
ncbi:four helix bundle protein [Christiangramia crocea]|uniref:Four helix bundle protein n=1 Tax=Christiangramia crocea TaxID=2904124 RepID=A0A9X2A4Q3_9FLAO|nr:four helix bundle protein [Gramella crocea]MCG9970605.1 four helix bundle protein [Gramella crocea]